MATRNGVRTSVLTESNGNRAGPKVPLEIGGFAAGDEVSVGHGASMMLRRFEHAETFRVAHYVRFPVVGALRRLLEGS